MSCESDRSYRMTSWLVSLVMILGGRHSLDACTNFLVTPGASVDGSTMITYAADSHVLYGELYHRPAATYPAGAMLEIIEWDTGKRLGEIPQARETYHVVGNINEFQLAIGETTWGGRPELQDTKGVIDYGSLMYIALQRAKTAREAIRVMTELVAEHGYYSTGESFSIADPKEAWILEMIGKGAGRKGAVWVARRIPDGYIAAHANAARIRQFPLNEPDTTRYSPDVISFAREMGFFDGPDSEFSFADAYAPPEYGARRFCDGRVWCMFHRVAPTLALPTDWVKGEEGARPLPLWIKPDRKLSVADLMGLMRDHFEGTEFDMTNDLGAGPYQLPYRWRPMTWKAGDQEYLHERATATQQTGFSFVTQSRGHLPDAIGGVLWFGVDDAASSVYFPAYCAIREVPRSYAVGNGSFREFRWDSAFWVFNFVSNYGYLRYRDMIQDIRRVQQELEGGFLAEQAGIEAAAVALHKQSPRLAIDYLTDYSRKAGDDVVTRWRQLGEFLIYKYLDGNVKDSLGNVTHPGYPSEWYETLARATGESNRMKKLKEEVERHEADTSRQTEQTQRLATAILELAKARGLTITDEQRMQIESSSDVEALKGWLIGAATSDPKGAFSLAP